MLTKQIYLDNNATTACDPRVVESMLPWFHESPGNASSRSHAFGWKAEEAVKVARISISTLLDVEPEEIIFTSGATESVNLALKGIFEAYRSKGNHIVTVQTEHKAVLDTCSHLEKFGAEVTRLEVAPDGLLDLKKLEAAIRPGTVLVAVMWANNETGVVQAMADIGRLCQERDILFFSDATQAAGKVEVHPRKVGVHVMAFNAHKMHGPKGAGALYISRRNPRVRIVAQMDGGGHERGLRSGTLNVPVIVGFGKAADIALHEMEVHSTRLRMLRDRLETSLLHQVEEIRINGSQACRLPQVTNISFRIVDSEALMSTFNRQIAVSSGSACTSASLEPSHVLLAMGLSNHLAQSALRFSVGRFNSEEEIDYTVAAVAAGVKLLRSQSPIWQLYQEGIDVDSYL